MMLNDEFLIEPNATIVVMFKKGKITISLFPFYLLSHPYVIEHPQLQ